MSKKVLGKSISEIIAEQEAVPVFNIHSSIGNYPVTEEYLSKIFGDKKMIVTDQELQRINKRNEGCF